MAINPINAKTYSILLLMASLVDPGCAPNISLGAIPAPKRISLEDSYWKIQIANPIKAMEPIRTHDPFAEDKVLVPQPGEIFVKLEIDIYNKGAETKMLMLGFYLLDGTTDKVYPPEAFVDGDYIEIISIQYDGTSIGIDPHEKRKSS